MQPCSILVQRFPRQLSDPFKIRLEDHAWQTIDVQTPEKIEIKLKERFQCSRLRKVFYGAGVAIAYGDEDIQPSSLLSGYFLVSNKFPPCRWRIRVFNEPKVHSFQFICYMPDIQVKELFGKNGLDFKLNGKVWCFREGCFS